MANWNFEPAKDTGLPPAERLKSVHREPGLVSSAARLAASTATAAYLRIYHRLTIRGAHHIPPEPPFVLVGNHESHLDALMLAAAIPHTLRPRVFPIAAGDTFFTSPASSAFAAMFMNALPLWRKSVGSHALGALRERLEQRGPAACGFILFPEGTRSRDGSLGRFKPGLGMLVAGTPVPVVPCWIDGAFEALPPDKKIPRPKKLTLSIGPPLTFASLGNEREGWTQLVASVEAAVVALRDGENGGSGGATGSSRASPTPTTPAASESPPAPANPE